MRKLFGFLKGFEKQLILGPLFKLTEAVFELFVPIVMARIIDIGVKGQNTAYVFRMGGLLLVLGFLGLAFALTAQYYAAVAQQGTGTALRNALFAHINTLSHAEIDQFGTHSLITRLTNDVNQLQFAVAMFIRLVVRAPFLFVGAIVMAITIDVKISLIFFAVAPILAMIIYFIMNRSVPFFKVIQSKLDKISLIARENLTGARVVRAFAKQNSEQERFEKASFELADTAVSVGRLSALMNPMNYVVMNIGIIAVIWFGGFQVNIGALTQGEVVAMINYMSQILLALVVVANLVVTFTKASASAARVNEVFDTKSSIIVFKKEEITISKTNETPILEFKNVNFAYNADAESILKGISFQARKGETIGIIGGTGSGKTSLINLIPRFYDVQNGSVKVDGVDVREYPIAQLRKKIGLVPQRASLISGTVADNIRWGSRQASKSEILEVLKIAQALSFVENLSNGMETKIEQGGKNLSGGQKQRLTIARALIGNPKILILDDSSSALDAATDFALRTALKEKNHGMTVIMVSQRANALKYADNILVLDEGELVGSGTHQQLCKTCQVYREICISQNIEEVGTNA